MRRRERELAEYAAEQGIEHDDDRAYELATANALTPERLYALAYRARPWYVDEPELEPDLEPDLDPWPKY